jgi:hypothetical protein
MFVSADLSVKRKDPRPLTVNDSYNQQMLNFINIIYGLS